MPENRSRYLFVGENFSRLQRPEFSIGTIVKLKKESENKTHGIGLVVDVDKDSFGVRSYTIDWKLKGISDGWTKDELTDPTIN